MTEKRIKIVLDVASAHTNARAFEGSLNRIGNATTSLNTNLTSLAKLISSIFAINQLARYADSWTMVSNKIRQATDELGQFYAVQQSVYEIAQGARSDVQGVALSFQRIDNAVKELGYSQADVMRVVEGLTLAFKANGQTAQEVSSTLIQLSQAFAKGRLDGDELRSVMEASLPVSRAIAKEFGVNVGQLKDLGEQGKLVTDRVFKAIINELPAFKAAFAESIPTIADSVTVLNNGLERFVGTFNEATGLSTSFNSAVKVIVAGLDEVSLYLSTGALGQFGELFSGQVTRALSSLNAFKGEGQAVLDALLLYGDEFSKQFTTVLTDAFFNAIPNINAFVQIMTVELAHAVDVAKLNASTSFLLSDRSEYDTKRAALDKARLDTIDAILNKLNEEKTSTKDILTGIKQNALERQVELDIERQKLEVVRERTATEVKSAKQIAEEKAKLEMTQRGQQTMLDIANENALIEKALTNRITMYKTYSSVLNDLESSDYEMRVARLEMQYAEQATREDEQYAKQLAKINERKLEISNNEKLSAEDRLSAIDLLNEQAQLQAAEHEFALNAIRESGVAARARLDKEEAKSRLTMFGQLGEALINLGQGHSRKIFGIGKTLAKAQAAVALPAAVMESFKNGGGYPWGLIPAGLMAAEGIANIRRIDSINFDGGGSASASVGGGGSTGSATVPQLPQAPETVQNLSIVGNEELVKELRDLAASDGQIPARIMLRYLNSVEGAKRIGA